jgi:hypothetical protein
VFAIPALVDQNFKTQRYLHLYKTCEHRCESNITFEAAAVAATIFEAQS